VGHTPLPDTLSRIPPLLPCQNDMKRGVNTFDEILEKIFGKKCSFFDIFIIKEIYYEKNYKINRTRFGSFGKQSNQ
jgi:hypothetical protein